MSDLISRAEAKEALRERFKRIPTYAIWAMHIIDELPTHPTPSNTLGALDCVSRQAAIEAIESLVWYHQNRNKDMVSGANSREDQPWYKSQDVYDALERLPSVKPRTGKWLIDNPHSEIYRYVCSECHAHHRARYDFCPSCGCCMEEGDAE